jgi:hypothetical protein
MVSFYWQHDAYGYLFKLQHNPSNALNASSAGTLARLLRQALQTTTMTLPMLSHFRDAAKPLRLLRLVSVQQAQSALLCLQLLSAPTLEWPGLRPSWAYLKDLMLSPGQS